MAQATFLSIVLEIPPPIWRLQRCVIWQWNGNFMTFQWVISKIVKNFPMKSISQFSEKWQKWPTPTWNQIKFQCCFRLFEVILHNFYLIDRSKFSNFSQKVSWFQLFVYIFQKFANFKIILLIQNHIITWNCEEATRSWTWFYYINLTCTWPSQRILAWPLFSIEAWG